MSVEWYARIVQSNATKDQDYIADGAVMIFEQGVNRRGEFFVTFVLWNIAISKYYKWLTIIIANKTFV